MANLRSSRLVINKNAYHKAIITRLREDLNKCSLNLQACLTGNNEINEYLNNLTCSVSILETINGCNMITYLNKVARKYCTPAQLKLVDSGKPILSSEINFYRSSEEKDYVTTQLKAGKTKVLYRDFFGDLRELIINKVSPSKTLVLSNDQSIVGKVTNGVLLESELKSLFSDDVVKAEEVNLLVVNIDVVKYSLIDHKENPKILSAISEWSVGLLWKFFTYGFGENQITSKLAGDGFMLLIECSNHSEAIEKFKKVTKILELFYSLQGEWIKEIRKEMPSIENLNFRIGAGYGRGIKIILETLKGFIRDYACSSIINAVRAEKESQWSIFGHEMVITTTYRLKNLLGDFGLTGPHTTEFKVLGEGTYRHTVSYSKIIERIGESIILCKEMLAMLDKVSEKIRNTKENQLLEGLKQDLLEIENAYLGEIFEAF